MTHREGIRAAARRRNGIRFDAAGVRIAAAAGEPGTARPISINVYNGGLLRLPSHRLPVVIDVAGVEAAPGAPIMLSHDNHDGAVLGPSKRVTAADGRVDVEGLALANTERQRNLLSLHDAGTKFQASIGGEVLQRETIAAGQTVTVNGRTFQGPLYVARRFLADEFTIVPFGADNSTSIAAKEGRKMTFQEWLTSLGLDESTMNAEQVRAARTTYDELEAIRAGEGAAADVDPAQDEADDDPLTPEPTPGRVSASRRETAAELRRQAEIIREAGDDRVLAARAIEENWTTDRVRVEVLRARRPSGAAFHVRGRNVPMGVEVITAAAARGLGWADKFLVDTFGERTMNAADPLGNLGLQDVLRAAARLDGIEVPYISMGVNDFIRAAFSSVSLPKILGQLANAAMLEARSYVEDTWRSVVSTSTVNNFNKHTRLRLTSNFTYEKVGPNGELKDLSQLGEETYEQQADTRGGIFWLGRKLIVNDDMGAWAGVPKNIQIGHDLALNKEVWTAWLDNAGDFFGTGNGNLLEGAGYALVDYNDVEAGVDKFRTVVDNLGNKLRVRPTAILVPGKLETKLAHILAPLLLNQTPADNGAAPMNNPLANKYKPLVSDYLDDATFHANASATAWYLLAPEFAACFDVGFLFGKQNPTIEPVEAPPGQLAMGWQFYDDFGVAQADYRGGVKVTGEAAA